MFNLIRAEFYKLRRSTGLKICFLLSCIFAASLVCILHLIAAGSMSSDISGSASGLTEIFVASLLGSMITGILICSDFETKTIHDAVACGNGRRSVVLSKVITYIVYFILLFLPYMAAVLIGLCTGDKFPKPFVGSAFAQLLFDESGHGITPGIIGRVLLVSVVTMLVHAARLSVCIPVAFKLRKPVAVMAIGFAFSFLIDLVVKLLEDVPVISDIISVTPFNHHFIIVTVNTSTETMIKAVICCIVFIVIMTLVTYNLFRRDEIK